MSDTTQGGSATTLHMTAQTVKGSMNTSPSFKEFESTGGRLGFVTGYVKSQTIRGDGQSTNNVKNDVTLNSEISFEVTEDLIDLIPSVLRTSATPSLVTYPAGSALESDSVTNKITHATTNIFSGIELYSFAFVEINGEVESVYVTSINTDKNELTCKNVVNSRTGPGDVKQRRFLSGKSANLLTWQEREEDGSVSVGDHSYATQVDVLVNTLSLTIPTSGPVTGTIGLVAGYQVDGDKKITGQTDVTPSPRTPLSNLDMAWVPEMMSGVNTKFTDVNIDISSNSEAIPAAGSEGVLDNTVNTITVTGSLNSITVASAPRIEQIKQADGVRFAMAYEFTFEGGKKMVISCPKMIYTEGSRERANDTTASFSGTYDVETGSLGSTLIVDTNY